MESENKNSLKADKLWNIFSRINNSNEIQQLYLKYNSISLNSGLTEILHDLSKQYDYNLNQSFGYFKPEVNVAYESDRINPSNIEINSFIMRLGNYVLVSIYKLGNLKSTVNDFIKEARKEREKNLKDKEPNEEIKIKAVEDSKKDDKQNTMKKNIKGEISKENNEENDFIKEKYLENDLSEEKHLENDLSKEKQLKNDFSKEKLLKNGLSKEKQLKNKENSEKISGGGSEVNKGKIDDSHLTGNAVKADIKDFKKQSKEKTQLNSEAKIENPSSESEKENGDNSPLLGGVSKKVIDEFKKINKENSSSEDEINKNPKRPSLDQSWSLEKFNYYKKQLTEIFSNFDKNKGKIKINEIIKLLISTADKLNLEVHDHQRILFSKLVEDFASSKPEKKTGTNKAKDHYNLNFEEFSELLKIWGTKYNEAKRKIEGKVLQTLQDLDDLDSSSGEFKNLSEIVSSLKQSLKSSLSNYVNSHKEDHLIQKSIKKNIEEIFLFYGKAQKIQGSSDTFEGLESSNNNWNLGKFFKFSSDFGILQAKPESERGLSKDQLLNIFKKTATNSRLMTEAQFIDSLDKISEVYFSIYFDNLLGSASGTLPTAEKRKLMYRALGFEKPNSYHSKVKAFAVPHTPANQIRQPKSNFLQKGEYVMPENLIKQIDHWKEKKIKILNSTPPTLRPNLVMPNRKYSESRKSTNDLPITETGYAKKMKKKEIVRESGDNKSAIEGSKERLFPDAVDVPKGKGMTNIITIKGLSQLDFQDFDSDNELNQLISEEKDEYFDKFYQINPKLKGIMKMHEEKLAKGQKVLEKIIKV